MRFEKTLERELNSLAVLFRSNGFQLYEVGGSLRDKIIGRDIHDVDMATDAYPEDTLKMLEEAGYANIYTVGIAYGTVGVVLNYGLNAEITTFRGEVYPTDSRKPNVEWGDNIYEDLERRDFTINSMARDLATDNMIDPFMGESDIRWQKIKCTGSGSARFHEDPLRMLRAIRFGCQLDFDIEVVMMHPERLSIVSKERIQEELNKILLTPRSAEGIEMICRYGLMGNVIPELLELQFLNQGKHHVKDAYFHTLLVLERVSQNNNSDEDELVLRLAALLHDIAKPKTMTVSADGIHFYRHQWVGERMARGILKRLRYPKRIIDRVGLLVAMHMSPLVLKDTEMTPRALRRLVRRVGEENIGLLIRLCIADVKAQKNDRTVFLEELWKRLQEIMKESPTKLTSPLNGDELMAILHIPPSKLLGDTKEYLTNLVVDGELDQGDKERAAVLAKDFVSRFSILRG